MFVGQNVCCCSRISISTPDFGHRLSEDSSWFLGLFPFDTPKSTKTPRKSDTECGNISKSENQKYFEILSFNHDGQKMLFPYDWSFSGKRNLMYLEEIFDQIILWIIRFIHLRGSIKNPPKSIYKKFSIRIFKK